jgi:hypothetical protein
VTQGRAVPIQLLVIFSRSVLLCTLLGIRIAHAKATTVTLAELTKESRLIVYGKTSTGTVQLQFNAVQVVKGQSLIQGGAVLLCNGQPNTEWPDLSKLTQEAVLFLIPHGDCFNLSHSYRSVVKVHDDRAATGAIKGEPDDQLLSRFLHKTRRLASK